MNIEYVINDDEASLALTDGGIEYDISVLGDDEVLTIGQYDENGRGFSVAVSPADLIRYLVAAGAPVTIDTRNLVAIDAREYQKAC